ncbi:hypothetical protein FN924_15310 [Radiobacillus deserti]|uniref:Uncharacterized protein n=2 Tax=Radiobacillus deserti TaxID=2594883 RepID=A0A516KJ59_9BACI|nr:hypothetical protein FN924_15310 [Radiobacillus deserti]
MADIKVKRLVDFMVKGDEASSWNLISQLDMDKNSISYSEDVLAKVMLLVGELWEMNELTVQMSMWPQICAVF